MTIILNGRDEKVSKNRRRQHRWSMSEVDRQPGRRQLEKISVQRRPVENLSFQGRRRPLENLSLVDVNQPKDLDQTEVF